MKIQKTTLVIILLINVFCFTLLAQNSPNIVLIFPDNIGMGEVNGYGGVRGVPTPNIDKIGNEGIKLTNFNVEFSCTPSRIALMTGRYATRAGDDYYSGTTLWENTIAEYLKKLGYATALFGKWDIGGENWLGIREPTNQGFDEWYGIPGTSHVSQHSVLKGYPKNKEIPYVWEGIAGQISTKVKPFDVASRRIIDREAAEKSVNFIRKNAEKKKPFFLYYPMTQLHYPALPHPDKEGSTGAGDMGDSMADVDYNVGLILKELEKLGIEKNTLVIWCSDNGAEMRRPWRGSSGAWRGYYNSAMEGGVRTPAVMRWTGRIKAGQVSNQMVHETDLLPTILAAAGGSNLLANDRLIDGVNQLPFLEGKQPKSNRESTLFMNRSGSLMAVKWQDWKLWYNFKTEMPDAEPDNLVRLFDLRADPQEEIDVKDHYPWVIGIMDSVVRDYEKSLVQYPRVSAAANAKDPYIAPPVGSGSLIATYTRTDRTVVPKNTEPILNPDFSGTWSTAEINTVSVINRSDKPKIATLGSGWGDKISIIHRADLLDIERIVFAPRETQPTTLYHYSLDGSITENSINMGRSLKPNKSSTKWQNNTLIITTNIPCQNLKTGTWSDAKLTQTLWLENAKEAPFEPLLVVETFREGILGGLASVNRTIYSRGYR